MATMTRFGAKRDALRAAREIISDAIAEGAKPSPVDVLLRDGDTIRVVLTNGRITHHRIAGHVTHGLLVDPTDLPCICG